MDEHPLASLRKAMLSALDHEQLVSLCVELGVPDEGVAEQSRESLVLRLTGFAARRGRIADLAAMARHMQPGSAWDGLNVPRDVRSAASSRHRLPSHVHGFIGREEEMGRAPDLFEARSPGVVIYGRGGAGKTSLAVHLCHRVAERFPDGQVFVRMQGSSGTPLGALEAAERVIHAFEPERRISFDDEEVMLVYHQILAGQKALIVVDDASESDQVTPLVPPPGSALLVTSRQPLAIAGLGLLHLGALPVDQARVLLAETTGTDADLGELDKITALCGRLPLAVRVVGGLMATHPDWSASYLTRELTEERVQLASIRLQDAEVEAALGLGVGHMAMRRPDLTARWQMLTVFPAPFDLIAAAAVWRAKEHEALVDLGQLVTRGLLLYDAQAGLYDLHDLVRPAAQEAFEYNESKEDDDGEPLQQIIGAVRARLGFDPERRRMERAASRHAYHYLGLGVLATGRYVHAADRRMEGLRLFDAVWPHLQEARQRTRARSDRRSARWVSDLARETAPILGLRLQPQNRLPILEGAVASAMRIGDRHSQAVHLGNLGLAYADMNEPQRAIVYHRQALGIHARLRDRAEEGEQWTCLGKAYLRLDEPEQAIKCQQKALTIHEQLEDRQAQGENLTGIAVAYRRLGDTRQTISHFTRALVIARQVGDRAAECSVLGNLGQAYRQMGDTERSVEYFEQSLAIARRIDDPRRECAALGYLGLAYGTLGDMRRAQACHRQALAIARRSGDIREQEIHLGNLGMACAALGQRERAIAYIQEALALSRQLGDTRGEAKLSWSLGLLVEWTDPSRAAQLMDVRVALARAEGDPIVETLRDRLQVVQERAESRQRDRRSKTKR
jgi:tetratricopeptide (TPR) repeat protein